MKTTRRTFLGGLAATSLPASVVAAAEPVTLSIDAFLARATTAELVRYHANALAEAMAEMHPAQAGWRIQIDHECKFAMIAGRRKVGKVSVVVDDVTGTTALADWEAGR